MAKKASEGPWRFERKYQLSPQEFIQFEKLMMLSDLKTLYPDRQINNCYFDSVKNDAYMESVEGYSQKMKVRIRWYGDLYGTVTPTLEFKLKQNHSNKKETFKLFETTIDEKFYWKQYTQNVQRHLLDNYKMTILNRVEPVLINSYKRSYYSNFQKTFRLTIDSNLTFVSPTDGLSHKTPRQIDSYIIELKSKNEKGIKHFPILKNLGKFSKFTTGRDLMH